MYYANGIIPNSNQTHFVKLNLIQQNANVKHI